jgi:hypothetical protein
MTIRRIALALVAAVLLWLPTAGATIKSYVGPAQLDPSLSAEEARTAVWAACRRNSPDLVGMTPGVLVFQDVYTTTMTFSSAEWLGECDFWIDPRGDMYGRVFSTRGKESHGSVGIPRSAVGDGKMALSIYGSGRVLSIRVAPDVASLDAHLPDGRTVSATIRNEVAVLLMPDNGKEGAWVKGMRMVLKDAAGVVLEDRTLSV